MHATSRSVRFLVPVLLVALLALAAAAAFGAGEARAGSGDLVWKHALDPTTHGDALWLCAPAPGGGVLLSGELDETADTNKIAVARYSAAGALAWSRVWTLPSTRHGTVNDAAVAKDGGLWVTGYL